MVSDPSSFVLSHCASPPNSFPNAVVQILHVAGSFMSFLYLVMTSFMIGWKTPAAKCSISAGSVG